MLSVMFIRSSHMIFIYSYSFIFTIIRHQVSDELTIDHLSMICCLVAQWIEHCTGIASHVLESCSNLISFSVLFQLLKNLLKLIAHCENDNFQSSLSALHIYDFNICESSGIYDELTFDHLSMWLGSSLERALHRYRKVIGSNPV